MIWLVAALAVPVVVFGESEVELRPAAELPVRILAPADGTQLQGGRICTISWRPEADLVAAGIEEWEAFLSFDGGRTWTTRITPHLDIGISSFEFTVPPVPSEDVRLMLRFGDERRELGYVTRLRLRSSAGTIGTSLRPLLSLRRGESARADGSGVSVWLDGRRDGTRLVWRMAMPAEAALVASRAGRLALRPLLFLPERRLTDEVPTMVGSGWAGSSSTRGAVTQPDTSGFFLSVRSVSCRQNE